MKRIFIVIFLICSVFLPLMSQETDKQEFTFIYIDHETNTPVSRLVEKLSEIKRDLVQMHAPGIFYMAAGSKPIIVRFNMENDNRADFDSLFVRELQEKDSHDIIASVDVDSIIHILSENDIIDGNGQLAYEPVTFDFYVGDKFWNLGNNEKVISTLFFALGLDKYPAGKVPVNIIRSSGDEISISKEEPYGRKNLGGINERLRVLQY